MDKKKIVNDFFERNKLAVISSVNSKGKPESAVIGFGNTKALELIFGTFKSTRKYKNLKNSQHASFVIGWDENITVQYEGIASELKGKEKDEYVEIFYSQNPQAKKYQSFKEERYFKVIPKWIRYSDLNREPLEIFEIEF